MGRRGAGAPEVAWKSYTAKLHGKVTQESYIEIKVTWESYVTGKLQVKVTGESYIAKLQKLHSKVTDKSYIEIYERKLRRFFYGKVT